MFYLHLVNLQYRELNPSFQTKDNKWKQVEVTKIFVSNEPILGTVPILGQPWYQENLSKVEFPQTLTLLDGTEIPFTTKPKFPAVIYL